MCKYCELKNEEIICLTDRKHDDLYISKVEDEYYIENEGFTKFKLKYCPMCGKDLQNESSKEIKDENNKFTITDSITVKDIFKYESRFSGSDEFDEL